MTAAWQDMTAFRALHTCFKRHIPHITLEKYPVDILSMDKIYRKTAQVIENNENCFLELTGGSELMVIAGFRAGMEKGARLIHTDLVHNRITDLLTDETVAPTATLSLEDFVDARGACFIGESHRRRNQPASMLSGKWRGISSAIWRNGSTHAVISRP